jgi:hypothetical protein
MSDAAVSDIVAEEVASAQPGVLRPSSTDRIKERPLLSLGLASLAGFVVGGGASSRVGAAMLMIIGRLWLRRAATAALTNVVTNYGTAKRSGAG